MPMCANTAALREYESHQAALEVRSEIVESRVNQALMSRVIEMLEENDALHIEAISETPVSDSNDKAARAAILNICRLIDSRQKGSMSAAYEALGVAVFSRIMSYLSPIAKDELRDEFSEELWG